MSKVLWPNLGLFYIFYLFYSRSDVVWPVLNRDLYPATVTLLLLVRPPYEHFALPYTL